MKMYEFSLEMWSGAERGVGTDQGRGDFSDGSSALGDLMRFQFLV